MNSHKKADKAIAEGQLHVSMKSSCSFPGMSALFMKVLSCQYMQKLVCAQYLVIPMS